MKLNTRYNFLLSIIIIITIEVVFIGASDESDDPLIPLYPRAFTVTQRLDHFNKSDTRFWEQRFFISGEHYGEDGPVFVMVGDDEAASSDFLTSRYQFMEYVKRYNALCLLVEQRFFGESQPTEDLSLDNLQYFTVAQALEDLVEFRAAMEYRFKLNNKRWIFFGSALLHFRIGLIATNLRIKYPLLVNGVVASCTQMIYKLDSSEILSATFKKLNKTSPQCVLAINTAVKQIEAYIEDGAIGLAKLSDIFKVCGLLNGNNSKDIEDFYSNLAELIFRIVGGSADGTAPLTDASLCEIMNDRMKGPEVDRLAHIMKLYLKPKNSDCMFERYETFIQLIKDTCLNAKNKNWRLEMYRLCTQRPYFYASEDPQMPFYSKYSVSFLIERCADIFGPQFDTNFIKSVINATNEKFGYEAIGDQSTNILFVSGAEDPQISLLISRDINFNVKAIVIRGESQCTDAFPTKINDSEELIKARLNIARVIGNWING